MLLSHLVMFGFIYPSMRTRIPSWAMDELTGRLRDEADSNGPDDPPVCNGTLLSWSQYLGDVLSGDFRDGRIRPHGNMTVQEVARWTAADKS